MIKNKQTLLTALLKSTLLKTTIGHQGMLRTTLFKLQLGLNRMLSRYYNYYGVSGNMEMLLKYFNSVMRLLFKWLNRRSQRKNCNYRGFRE